MQSPLTTAFFIASAMRRDSSMLEETPGTCTNVVGTPASGRDADTEGGNLVTNEVNNNQQCLLLSYEE